MKKWRGIHLGDVWFDVTSFPADMPVRAAAKEVSQGIFYSGPYGGTDERRAAKWCRECILSYADEMSELEGGKKYAWRKRPFIELFDEYSIFEQLNF